MRVFQGLEEAARVLTDDLVVALGNYDGVHVGHQSIIRHTVGQAEKRGLKSAVLTFNPHPTELLFPNSPILFLTDIEERIYRLGLLGIDHIIIEPFTLSLASLSPEEFISKQLINKLGINKLMAGYNYTFGYKGQGRAVDLVRYGKKYGFSVDIYNPVSINRKVVSSSLIRELILKGNISEATIFLKYYLPRKGKIIKGRGRGKYLGFPTANLELNPQLVWPKNGVYLTGIQIENNNNFLYGLANIGVRPTFENFGRTLEVYVLNFDGNLYKKEIRILFLEKLRDERAFKNEELLKKQINKDINIAKDLIKKKYINISRNFLK